MVYVVTVTTGDCNNYLDETTVSVGIKTTRSLPLLNAETTRKDGWENTIHKKDETDRKLDVFFRPIAKRLFTISSAASVARYFARGPKESRVVTGTFCFTFALHVYNVVYEICHCLLFLNINKQQNGLNETIKQFHTWQNFNIYRVLATLELLRLHDTQAPVFQALACQARAWMSWRSGPTRWCSGPQIKTQCS